MKKHMLQLSSLLTGLFITSSMLAQSVSGLELMKQNELQTSSENEVVELTMELINNKNAKRSRTIKRYSYTDSSNNQSTLIRFLAPADVAGTGFLEIENPDRLDDQWLYLPALNRSRRISPSNETDNFMGSDFTYEDIGNEDLKGFHYDYTGDEMVNRMDCYMIIAKPATTQKQQESGYQKREIYLCKETHIVTKINFFDKNDVLLKTLDASQIKQIAGTDKYRAHILTMKNQKTGHQTVLILKNYSINQGVDKELFTKRNLESGT